MGRRHLKFAFQKASVETCSEGIHADKSWPDGDRGEFFNWLVTLDKRLGKPSRWISLELSF